MKNFLILFSSVLVAAIFGLTSCQYKTIDYEAVVIPDTVSFSVDVEPIFSANGKCTSCHPSTAGLDLTVGNAYNSIVTNGYVVAGDMAASSIFTKPAPNEGHPKEYTAAESNTVGKWIEQGALDN